MEQVLTITETGDEAAVRSILRSYASDRLDPFAAQRDRDAVFPREVWADLARLGVMGMRVSEERGGTAVSYRTVGIASEEIARADFSCGYIVPQAALLGELLDRFATPQVHEEWLPRFVDGSAVIGLGLTESQGGSDAANVRTVAKPDSGSYVITGEKSGLSLIEVADAAIVVANVVRHGQKVGPTAFLVPLDNPGVQRTHLEDMGARAMGRGMLYLSNVVVPDEYRIGEEGAALRNVFRGFNCSRVLLTLGALALAIRTVEETVEYLTQRVVFGKPLATRQALRFSLAEYWTRLDMARVYCYHTLGLRDMGRPHTSEAAGAKFLGCALAVDAVRECLLLHGHYGYTQDLPLERRLRDLIGSEIGDGTPHIGKMIVARELFARGEAS